MKYTDLIAVIDLGTTHITGIVGLKESDGKFRVITHEVENSGSCIRRGFIYKVRETADKITRIVRKLENRFPDDLKGAKIEKVYVGIEGQSLRSIKHTVPRILGADGLVTEEVLESLEEECRNYKPDMFEVFDAVSPVYFLDDNPDSSPVGAKCYRIEARYQLIVGWPSLRNNIVTSITDYTKIKIAGVLISPLTLADVVLNDEEKELGCAVIDFGGGVTTLTLYKGGNLINLSVIPFGSNLITKDLTDILPEEDAEDAKRNYGSAKREKDNSTTVPVGSREIKLAELNNIIEARSREILENVYARIKDANMLEDLSSVVITGGGSSLKQLDEVIRERLKVDVRYASVRKDILIVDDMDLGKPIYTVAMSLLTKGEGNCVHLVTKEKPPKPINKSDSSTKKAPVPSPSPTPPTPKSGEPSGGLFGRIKRGVDGLTRDLFDDNEASDNQRTK